MRYRTSSLSKCRHPARLIEQGALVEALADDERLRSCARLPSECAVLRRRLYECECTAERP